MAPRHVNFISQQTASILGKYEFSFDCLSTYTPLPNKITPIERLRVTKCKPPELRIGKPIIFAEWYTEYAHLDGVCEDRQILEGGVGVLWHSDNPAQAKRHILAGKSLILGDRSSLNDLDTINFHNEYSVNIHILRASLEPDIIWR